MRHILFAAAAMIFAAATCAPFRAAAQPFRPEYDNRPGSAPNLHLFLPSNFIRSIYEDQLVLARTRSFRAAYRHAINRGLYKQALAYSDSLIYLVEHHPIPGIRFSQCYKDRAQMLAALHRDSEACLAYERTIRVKDSIMRFEQDDIIREMQASYELDRLALDQALHTADHHKTALIAILLLIAGALFGIGFIYIANRRTKRLQQQLLLEMQRACESEQKKTAFINSICHEVRTPLNCVAGFSELLCADDITPEAHGQYCEVIRENRRQLRYIFDDMLEVAYLENLHEPLPRDYVNLCNLCRMQIRTMKIRHTKPGVTYTERIPSEDIGLRTNEKYLGLLLAALLDNARKFTGEGTVDIECGRESDERVFIAVTDTGCGIPPEQREYVFERFTKLDTFSPGNGLGLYLCLLIARHLDGEIHIDPAYSGGTRIVTVLPRK